MDELVGSDHRSRPRPLTPRRVSAGPGRQQPVAGRSEEWTAPAPWCPCRRSCSRARRRRLRPMPGRSWRPSSPHAPVARCCWSVWTGGGWVQVARKRQDSWGSAAFAVQPGTYRARTEISMGREVQTGRVVSRAWTPEFEDTFSGRDARRHRVERPAPRARERVCAPHLRPHRPRRTSRRGRRAAPRHRPRPRAPRPALPVHDRRRGRASSPTCSPVRSPPSTPGCSATASPPPA